MKSSLIIAVACFGLMGVGGCELRRPTADVSVDSPVSAKTTPADLFDALAQCIEANPKTISTPSELAQFVLVLVKNGELSGSYAAQFDAAFPNATTDQRELTAADAVTLRRIK